MNFLFEEPQGKKVEVENSNFVRLEGSPKNKYGLNSKTLT